MRRGLRGRPSRAGVGDWRGAARRPRAAARAARRPWRALTGRAGPASRRAGRRRGRAGAGTRMIIMPYAWSWPIAAAHRPSRLLAPHTSWSTANSTSGRSCPRTRGTITNTGRTSRGNKDLRCTSPARRSI